MLQLLRRAQMVLRLFIPGDNLHHHRTHVPYWWMGGDLSGGHDGTWQPFVRGPARQWTVSLISFDLDRWNRLTALSHM